MTGFSLHTNITCVVLSLLFSFSSNGQTAGTKHFSQQLSFVTENDRYLMQGNDRYYSNGLILQYSRVHHAKKASVIKQVNQYEIGQKLYTAFSRKIDSVSQIDRPITGYLYVKFMQSNFIKQNQLWQWGVSVGTIGSASLGKQMQNMVHKIITINTSRWSWIWNYQLKSEPGINLHGLYARSLLNSRTSIFQLTPVTQAVLGSSFTNVSQGVLLQLGKFNPLYQSAYWNASSEERNTSTAGKSELFFYYYPQLMYQLYNATVQGGLFRKEKGPITSSLKPFVVMQQLGIAFSRNRYSMRVETSFQTKEAVSQRFSHDYGSFYFSYRFD